jgi:prepilin-type N-terminal cleavage/methylation domain-containing protein
VAALRSNGQQEDNVMVSEHFPRSLFRPLSTVRKPLKAFTLIEMLVVISIIGIVASLVVAFVLPKAQLSRLKQATAELHGVATAIDSYHQDFGTYPPDNTTQLDNYHLNGFAKADYLPPLLYELVGAAFDGKNYFGTNDFRVSASSYQSVFGMMGPQNSSPETLKNYLPGLKLGQYKAVESVNPSVYVLTCSVGTGTTPSDVSMNPWIYNKTNPTNNPASYDLFTTNILIGSKWYTIGNN